MVREGVWHIETFLSSKLWIFRSDGGGEYINHKICDFSLVKESYIKIMSTHSGTKWYIAERKHRHRVEMALSMVSKSYFPSRFWYFAFATAVCITNCLPSLTLNNKSPFSCLYFFLPDYFFLWVFGCPWYQLLRPYNSNKLQPCATQCVFLDYLLGYKRQGYDISKDKFYSSQHVIFDE